MLFSFLEFTKYQRAYHYSCCILSWDIGSPQRCTWNGTAISTEVSGPLGVWSGFSQTPWLQRQHSLVDTQAASGETGFKFCLRRRTSYILWGCSLAYKMRIIMSHRGVMRKILTIKYLFIMEWVVRCRMQAVCVRTHLMFLPMIVWWASHQVCPPNQLESKC